MSQGKLHSQDYNIQFKQGVAANINTTATKNLAVEGEPHWATDTDQLYVFDGTQNVHIPTEDSSGDAWVTRFLKSATANYRRYYHLGLASFDPGASGAVWTEAGANTVGGWQLDNSGETLQTKVDIHSDWDGASDVTIEARFQINDASTEDDTVDITAVFYYMKKGELSTRTQTVTGSTNLGLGGVKAQYTMFEQDIVLPHDTSGQELTAGDCISMQLYLNTTASEVDNIILNAVSYYYNTTHLGIESGDT